MPHCYLVFLLLGGAKEELLCFGASDQKKDSCGYLTSSWSKVFL